MAGGCHDGQFTVVPAVSGRTVYPVLYTVSAEAALDGAVEKDALGNSAEYLDVSIRVDKMVTDEEGASKTTQGIAAVTELVEPVEFSYPLTGDAADGTDFHVLREHDGDIEELECRREGDALLFSSDKFSSFARRSLPRPTHRRPPMRRTAPPEHHPRPGTRRPWRCGPGCWPYAWAAWRWSWPGRRERIDNTNISRPPDRGPGVFMSSVAQVPDKEGNARQKRGCPGGLQERKMCGKA